MKRGNAKKQSNRLITLYVPERMLPAIAAGVRAEDTDRSKFIRAAIREKLSRNGIYLGGDL